MIQALILALVWPASAALVQRNRTAAPVAAVVAPLMTPAIGALPGAAPVLPAIGTAAEAPAAPVSAIAAVAAAPAQTASPADLRQGMAALAQSVAPQAAAAHDASSADPRGAGESIQRLLEGRQDEQRQGYDPVLPYPGGPSTLPDARRLYSYAFSLASDRAAAWNVPPSRVAFKQMSASLPAGSDRTVHFTFVALDPGPHSGREISVTLSGPMIAGRLPIESRVAATGISWAVQGEIVPELSAPETFNRFSRMSPGEALSFAQSGLPALGGAVSFALAYERSEGGDVGLYYRFFDDAGNVVAVNARTGGTLVEKDAKPARPAGPPGPWRSLLQDVKPLGTPAVGATAALTAVLGRMAFSPLMRHLTDVNGYNEPMSAVIAFIMVLVPVVWAGAAILYFTGAGLRDGKKLPRQLAAGLLLGGTLGLGVTVILPAILKGLAGTVALAGIVRRAPQAPAPAALPALYRAASEAAVKAAGQAKLPPPQFVEARLGRYGWSFDFLAGGRQILALTGADGRATAYAYGEAKAPEGRVVMALAPSEFAANVTPEQALAAGAKAFGVASDKLGLSARLLGEQRAQLWYVVDTESGKRYAVSAATGRGRALPASAVTPDQVASAAKSAASYKGRPWSSTEYNMQSAGVQRSLESKGATVAQLAMFNRLLDAAPVLNGGFNPWSGD